MGKVTKPYTRTDAHAAPRAEPALSLPAGKWDWERALKARSRREGLRPSHQHLALVLSTYADADGGSIRPTKRTLREVTGLSLSTIYEGLRQLEQRGWIEMLSRGSGGSGQATLYRLSVPSIQPEVHHQTI